MGERVARHHRPGPRAGRKMTRIPMTPAGFARLSAELKELKDSDTD